MKVRGLLVAGLTVAVLAIPGVALAKGPSLARLAGPGLSGPVTVGGDGEPGSGGRLAELSTQTGLFPAMFTETPNPMFAIRPAGGLGPRYVITYIVPSGTGQDEIRQEVYPYADAGPLTYTRPGQRFFGDQATLGGWFRSPATLRATVAALGARTKTPAPASSPATDPIRRASASPPLNDGFPLALVLLAAASLVVLVGVGFGVRRRHLHRGNAEHD